VRSVRVPALVVGVAVLVSSASVGVLGQRAQRQAGEQRDAQLTASAQQAATVLGQTLERARAIDLVLAHDPSFRAFATAPGDTARKAATRGGPIDGVNDALRYLDTVFPGRLDSAGFADARGREAARFAARRLVLPGSLGTVAGQPYFGPALTLGEGNTYLTAPYASPYSGEWVVSIATVVAAQGRPVGVVHYSLTLDSLRTAVLGSVDPGVVLRVVDPWTGDLVVDSRRIQPLRGSLDRTGSADLPGLPRLTGTSGLVDLGAERLAYVRMTATAEQQVLGHGGWLVVASGPAVGGLVDHWGALALALLALGVAIAGVGVLSTVRLIHERAEEQRRTRAERDHLSRRLGQVSDALRQVSSGELGAQMPPDDDDDEAVGALVDSLHETVGWLRVLVGQAQSNGEELSRSATQLRALATEQAAASSQQATAVSDTSVTVRELAATASQIAESAEGVSRATAQVLALSEHGRGAVQQSMAAMDRIAHRVDSMSASTSLLGEKVQEIGGIVGLLDDLSEQSNLLALNAAIEAARAGEHGRGFSVVAAEVRKLAERAQESTARIQGLVAEISEQMRVTAVVGEQSVREVREGSVLAEGAVTSLDTIAERVEDTATAVKEISIATRQQRTASDQVVDVMGELSVAAERSASGARQAALAADQMAFLAHVMQSSIETFRPVGTPPEGPREPADVREPMAGRL